MITQEMKILKFEKASGDFYLKPCPFCGNNEIVFINYDTKVGNRWAVGCANCLAMIDPGWAQDRSTVMNMWNRRQIMRYGEY